LIDQLARSSMNRLTVQEGAIAGYIRWHNKQARP
jgi:hypothetical protein